MHAQATATSVVPACLVPASSIKSGDTFVRLDSPSEVLAPMTFAGGDVAETAHVWAVVIAVNHDSEGYMPGQLLRIRRDALVRRVHEARAPVYALEQ